MAYPQPLLDFTIALLYRTTQSVGALPATDFRQGVGLASAAVASNTLDYGVSIVAGRLHAGIGGPSGTGVTLADTADTKDGAWHMAVFTRNAHTGRLELWRDGNLVASATGHATPLSAPGNLLFGAHPPVGAPTGFLVGDLAEFVLFEEAIPPRIIRHVWRAVRNRPRTNFRSTLLRLDSFAASEARTPHELEDAANAFSRYRTKVGRNRLVRLDPFPAAPRYAIGPWAADRFEDTSANSAEEIYNVVEASAQGFDGAPVRIRRFASELPEAPVAKVSTPAFANANPAAGNNTQTMSGLWRRGVTYRLRGKYTHGGAAGDLTWQIQNLDTGERAGMVLHADAGQAFTWELAWTPGADTTNVRFDFVGFPAGTLSALYIGRGLGTVLDRRDEIRVYRLALSFQATREVLAAFADAFLRIHRRTPMRGSITIAPGDLLDLKTGAIIHPRLLVCEEGELIHFHSFTDLDTGATGRDGAIASVTYEPATELAQVAIDNQRDNFEVLLQRYAALQGGQ